MFRAEKVLKAENEHPATETVPDKIELADPATVGHLPAHISYKLLESSERDSIDTLPNHEIREPLQGQGSRKLAATVDLQNTPIMRMFAGGRVLEGSGRWMRACRRQMKS